ncbi:MAG: transglycosylase domain-containing protein [Vampirovibrionales bacterium]
MRLIRFLINLALGLAIILACLLWKIFNDTPSLAAYLNSQGEILPRQLQTTRILAADGSLLTAHENFSYKPVKLSDISPAVVQAIVATEDRRFYEHHGVDPVGIVRAIFINLTSKRLSEGASTITQQLVRNLFLSNERSFTRKFREIILALKLEMELPKERILELYLNSIYFGEGAYGIGAASEAYFHKAPSQLTLPESALLAGLPQAPSRLNPFENPRQAYLRRSEVLKNLVEVQAATLQQISPYVQSSASAQGLFLAPRRQAARNLAPYFTQWVQDRVQALYNMDDQTFWQSGMVIQTTIQPQLQAQTNRVLVQSSRAWGRTGKDQQAASVSVDVQTGAILAYAGGKDFTASQFDRVTQSLRSPGSVFKMFTYAGAFEYLDKVKPNTRMVDEPIQYGTWKPQNFDKRYHGAMSVAKAFVQSNNIIAVKLLEMVGPSRVAGLAHAMGIKSSLVEDLSLTLGGSGVTMLELAEAASVFPNFGMRIPLYGIASIQDQNKRVIYRHQPAPQSVLSRRAAELMVGLMRGVVTVGTGRSVNLSVTQVAGKTGTSDEFRDAWFVGFTPETLTAVWVGNDSNTPMGKISGGSLPATMWRGIMTDYIATHEHVRTFPFTEKLANEVFYSSGRDRLDEEAQGTGQTAGEEVPLPSVPAPDGATQPTPSEEGQPQPGYSENALPPSDRPSDTAQEGVVTTPSVPVAPPPPPSVSPTGRTTIQLKPSPGRPAPPASTDTSRERIEWEAQEPL